MKLLVISLLFILGLCQCAPQRYSADQQLNSLVRVIDRNVDARIELLTHLLQIWRNARIGGFVASQSSGISQQGILGPFSNVPTGPISAQMNSVIPNHGHTHGHDSVNQLGMSVPNEDEEFLGVDPEHSDAEVTKEDFENNVVPVDKKPIVPIMGKDH